MNGLGVGRWWLLGGLGRGGGLGEWFWSGGAGRGEPTDALMAWGLGVVVAVLRVGREARRQGGWCGGAVWEW